MTPRYEKMSNLEECIKELGELIDINSSFLYGETEPPRNKLDGLNSYKTPSSKPHN
jgi:hypothetical protein